MAIRISGLSSGLDTEAIVQQLVSAYSYKKDTYVKAQTKLSWKQNAWKDLNTKIYSLYSKIGNMRYSSAYTTKKAVVSDSTKANVTASSSATNGSQTLEIKKLAKGGYLTGGELTSGTTGATTLGELGYASGSGSISITSGGKTTDITVDENTTVDSLVKQLGEAGVNASYDATNRRIFISAKETGVANDFSLTGANEAGTAALTSLGLNVASKTATATYQEWGAYALNEDGNAYYNEDGTTNGTYSEAKTQANLVSILDQINKANEDISSAKNSSTQEQAAITTNNGRISYANAYAGVQDADQTAKDNGMSDDQLKDLKTLSKLSTADLNKEYLVDQNGNLAYDAEGKLMEAGGEYDKDLYHTAKGSDILEDLQKKAGLITTKEEIDEKTGESKTVTDKSAATAYSKNLQTMDAYDDEVTKEAVQKIYEGAADAPYTSIADYTAALTADNTARQATIENNNAVIADANKLLDRYALVNNGQDAVALADRVSYATKALAGGLTYSKGATRVNGQDAEILLNNAKFTASSNTFKVNGMTIEALEETQGEISITTNTDTDAVYNKIKDFIKQYNELINEMTSLYNASSAKGYEPLTSEEKDAMTDTEIEEWEKKIKESLLRRDDTLDGVMNAMTNAMAKSFSINGKNYSLGSFGISTMGYLNSSENQQNAYHIDGDPDDENTSGKKDKLRAAIEDDPDTLVEFMKQLTEGLYSSLDAKMKSTSLSSAYKVYNDKQMEKDYKEYTSTISKWEEKVSDMEDRYYKQFAAMEKALATLQSSTSSLTGLMG
ncbi:MAG: flagellar filament capping protein FliD [Lachnospiraceae bacterium]|nr:flagellar filament capping protein FliD [Lachnospiraceae bacterium]